jgi:small subunit ribosomal protein S6
MKEYLSMRRYEVVFVLAPTLTEEQVKEQIETYSTVAKELGANVLDVDDWGKRRLAYPVKKFTDGIYTVLTLEEEAAKSVKELERRFRVTDSVIRFLTVRVDEDLKRAEKMRTRREMKRSRSQARATEAKQQESAARISKPRVEEENQDG